MSLPDFIQDNLEFLIEELDTRASQQLMANGHVEDRLLDIINGLESYLPAPSEDAPSVDTISLPDPVVEAPEEVVEEAPEDTTTVEADPVIEAPEETK
jgi:hypothetical protein